MRLVDQTGRVLNADLDIEPTPDGVDVILHARSGTTKTSRGRNTEYFQALEELLRRLSGVQASISRVAVDSRVALQLPLEARIIELPYPIHLTNDIDSSALRVRMTEGQRNVASNVVSGRGGNKHKRIRIAVDLTRSGITQRELLLELGTASLEDTLHTFGRPYRTARSNPPVRPGELFSVDPARHERALATHASIQNALARVLRAHGHDPRSPASGEPDFDIAWLCGAVVVTEVKSLSGTDETQQLRLGLGQVLYYRRVLRSLYGTATAVLAVEYEPPSPWPAVCADVDVVLSWPPDWPGLPI